MTRLGEDNQYCSCSFSFLGCTLACSLLPTRGGNQGRNAPAPPAPAVAPPPIADLLPVLPTFPAGRILATSLARIRVSCAFALLPPRRAVLLPLMISLVAVDAVVVVLVPLMVSMVGLPLSGALLLLLLLPPAQAFVCFSTPSLRVRALAALAASSAPSPSKRPASHGRGGKRRRLLKARTSSAMLLCPDPLRLTCPTRVVVLLGVACCWRRESDCGGSVAMFSSMLLMTFLFLPSRGLFSCASSPLLP